MISHDHDGVDSDSTVLSVLYFKKFKLNNSFGFI